MIADWKNALANIFAPAGKIPVFGCRPQGSLSASAVDRAAQPLPCVGWSDLYEAIARREAFRNRFPFEFVSTTGDNIIGRQDAIADCAEKFE